MKKWNCLIVDDEPIARDILLNYCSHLQSLEVVGACGNVLDAKKILEELRVDILFLDIHLPVMNGISFFSTLKDPPQVIFTTAYKEYAVNAFDLSACDYLVKPFLMDRFMIAVDKAIKLLSPQMKNTEIVKEDSFFIRTEGKIYKIRFDDLLFAEANGNYTKLVTSTITIAPNISFINLEKLLVPEIFRRVHRSFIVNTSKITHLEGGRVFIGKHEVPVGINF